jgi:ABC-type glutathione transport system ATPase component
LVDFGFWRSNFEGQLPTANCQLLPPVSSLLSVSQLSLAIFGPGQPERVVVRDVSCELNRGEVLGFVGGVGAGKSMLLGSLSGLLPPRTRVVCGAAILDPGAGSETSLLRLSARARRGARRTRLALLHRNISDQWNPGLTVRQHLRESLALAGRARDLRREADWMPVLYEVGLIEPESLLGRCPRELPDALLQRFSIAMALMKGADLWIADEPTSALDATGEDQILRLLRELCERHQFGLLAATHHFGVIDRLADRVAVLFEGAIVETGPVGELLRRPRHRYTRALLNCLPRLGEHRPRLGEIDRVAERDAIDRVESA